MSHPAVLSTANMSAETPEQKARREINAQLKASG
jgi:hypothetical protein